MLKRLGESILTGASILIALLVGAALAVLSFLWYFVPKKERQWRAAENAEAARRAAEIKVEIQKAHEARKAETAVKVAEVEKKAEEQKAQDSVALANAMLKDD
jgi:hypothetical protein